MSAKLSHAEVSQSLEPIYKILADRDTDEPWTWPVCALWSSIALPLARVALQNDSLEHIVRTPSAANKQKYGIPFTYHHFLADVTSDDPIILDGTYLQFAGWTRVLNPPHVLVAPASQTANLLADANVDPDHYDQWRVGLYGPEVFKKLGRDPLSAILKEPL